MKRILIIFMSLIIFNEINAQSYQDSVSWQGLTRTFRVYVPAIYLTTDTVPLVFALHGLGDNTTNFENIGMNPIADTANFIVVYPQALYDPFTTGTSFSSGINYLSSVDDVGLINYLIDTLITQYHIDTTRVYATGFSMGAFMTHRLGCQLSNRLTAIASVSGQIAKSIPPQCNPVKEIPVMHVHGTDDQTVNYNGDDLLEMISVDSMLTIWKGNNGCSDNPIVSQFPDNEPDGFVTTNFRWINCANNSEILLYRVDSAEHQWLYSPANDFDTATEIWKFFMRHPNNGLSTEIGEGSIQFEKVYPNPTKGDVTFVSNKAQLVQIIDLFGREVFSIQLSSGNNNFSINQLESGVYLLKSESCTTRLLVE